jgi:hypothetical protein
MSDDLVATAQIVSLANHPRINKPLPVGVWYVPHTAHLGLKEGLFVESGDWYNVPVFTPFMKERNILYLAGED